MDIKDEIKALKERIAELEELAKEEQEFPQEGDTYWYFNTYGDVGYGTFQKDTADREILEIGHLFKSEQQAEFAVEKLKVEAELRKYSKPFEMLSTNWLIAETEESGIKVQWSSHSKSQGTLYFESEEKAQQAIESDGEHRIKKYIFGVE